MKTKPLATSGVGTWLALLAMSLSTVSPARAQGTDPCGCEGDVSRADVTLTLQEAVRTALAQNRDLVTARHRLDEAGDRVSEAWGNLYPTVDLGATYTRNITPAVNFVPAAFLDPDAGRDELVPLQFGADNVWSMSVDVEQLLFKPAVFVGVGAADRFANLQREAVRGSALEVVTRVRTAYYDLLLAEEQERLTENSVRRVRETLEETRALNRAGLSSDFDVLRLEVELANLEPNLLRARNSVRRARRELGLALDVDDTVSINVEGSLATMNLDELTANTSENRGVLTFVGVEVPPDSGDGGVETLVSTAFQNRSDLRQLELTETLRSTEMKLEQVEYLPELSLFGTYGINASQNGSPDFFGEPRAYTRLVGVQFTLPVFEGFRRDARIDQKRAALRAAETQTSFARDAAAVEVRTLADQVREAKARASAQRLAVEQAQRGFEIARAQFAEGLGSRLELTDSEVALRESEFNYAQAVYDFLVARARLDEATGRVPMTDGLAEDTG